MTRFTSAAAALLLALPAAANATFWHFTGTFDDGTTVTGRFDVNVYAVMDYAELTTQTAAPFTGFTYTRTNSYTGSGPLYIDLQPLYQSDLHIEFAHDLTVAAATNPITGGYECQGSYSCYDTSGGITRYLVSGVATVPEPATWALMIGGFGLAGTVLRRRRAVAA